MTEPTALEQISTDTAAAIFTGAKQLDDVIAEIREQATSEVFDVTTAKGRKACASMAHKITRSKTAIDNAGKELTADWKAKAKAVDIDRKRMRDALDALKAEVRKPLDDWEAEKAAEEKRQADMIAHITELGNVQKHETTRNIDTRTAALEKIGPLAWLGRRRAEGEQQVELARKSLQAARIIAEAAEKAVAEKAAAEKAEIDRRMKERIEAEKRRVVEEERRRAQATVERMEREKQDAIVRERLRAERETQRVENDRIANDRRMEAARAAEARAAEEDRHRAAEQQRAKEAAAKAAQQREMKQREAAANDETHRATVHGEIQAALIDAKIGRHSAKLVISLIAAGKVPHVRIDYTSPVTSSVATLIPYSSMGNSSPEKKP